MKTIFALMIIMGPTAVISIIAMWYYLLIKKADKEDLLGSIVYFPIIIKTYKAATKEKTGRIGMLYYIFIISLPVAILSLLLLIILKIVYGIEIKEGY